ncbi:MAG TPA: GNAT family N-acetyltransferase [Pseudonocardia sp.]|nr:GNAT family N-acetyltransferase [Pseudonocardia sp.]
MTATSGSSPVTIRDAVAGDGPALTTLVRTSRAYDGRYRVLVAGQTIDDAYVRAHPVRVAAHGARPVGFASLLVPGRGGAGDAELDFMFVADGEQGTGLGRLLSEDLRRHAAERGIRRIHIVAHPPAEAFYRRIGATRVGAVPPSGRVTWSRPLLVLPVA